MTADTSTRERVEMLKDKEILKWTGFVFDGRFEQAMRKNVYEERQNQLRWQVKLGDVPMFAQDKAKVLSERSHCWALYQVIVLSFIY